MEYNTSPRTKTLNSWYPGREFFPLLWTKHLTHRQRLLISAVAYRERKSLPITAADLQRSTRVDNSREIPKLLEQLDSESGLIDYDKASGLIRTREPEDITEFFQTRTPPANLRHWSEQVAYDRYYILADKTELSIGNNIVLWTLVGKSEDGLIVEGQHKNGLAAITGVSDKTVERSFDLLEQLGFIEPLGAGVLGLFPPDARRLACFREKEVVEPKEDIEAIKARHRAAVSRVDQEFDIEDRYRAINRALKREELFPLSDLEDGWVSQMEEDAFSPEEIVFVIRAIQRGLKSNALTKFWKDARKQANSSDYFPLLRHKIRGYFGADAISIGFGKPGKHRSSGTINPNLYDMHKIE